LVALSIEPAINNNDSAITITNTEAAILLVICVYT
jgi:hypothetical protein